MLHSHQPPKHLKSGADHGVTTVLNIATLDRRVFLLRTITAVACVPLSSTVDPTVDIAFRIVRLCGYPWGRMRSRNHRGHIEDDLFR